MITDLEIEYIKEDEKIHLQFICYLAYASICALQAFVSRCVRLTFENHFDEERICRH